MEYSTSISYFDLVSVQNKVTCGGFGFHGGGRINDDIVMTGINIPLVDSLMCIADYDTKPVYTIGTYNCFRTKMAFISQDIINGAELDLLRLDPFKVADDTQQDLMKYIIEKYGKYYDNIEIINLIGQFMGVKCAGIKNFDPTSALYKFLTNMVDENIASAIEKLIVFADGTKVTEGFCRFVAKEFSEMSTEESDSIESGLYFTPSMTLLVKNGK